MGGYRIPKLVRRRVAKAAGHRCCYCRTAQEISGAQMHVDHIVPLALGGTSEERNLCLVSARRNWVLAGWHPPTE